MVSIAKNGRQSGCQVVNMVAAKKDYQHFAKFPLNRHYNARNGVAQEYYKFYHKINTESEWGEQDESRIVAEALDPDPVGPCLKTSLIANWVVTDCRHEFESL
ncbi:hypothetical protein TNCV_1391001 [Trichonephila clavipes]|nr:hypothetical protein TNCV_1391001 [Trichonephila clavipes]